MTAIIPTHKSGHYEEGPTGKEPSHVGWSVSWNMLTDETFYRELGTDYYRRCKPAKAKARAGSQLEALGYTVTLKPLADTA